MRRLPWWARLAGIGALVMGALEATMLEVRRGYFAGGFLAENAATSWSDRLLFVAGSLIGDVAVLSAAVVAGLWLARRWRLTPVAAGLVALALAMGPLVIWTLLEYQVLATLGDAFDAPLMFDLAGGSVREFLAVSASHLAKPLLALVAALGLGGLGIWAVHRATRGRFGELELLPRPGRALRGACAVWLVGATATTVARVSNEVVDNGLKRKASGAAIGAVAEWLSDVDRDGYGIMRPPLDPALFDARIYPYASDVPGNGIDEDGVGGDLPPGEPYTEGPATAPAFTRRPPVVLFVLESFRADNVGAIARGTPIAPVLEALAASGVSSSHAYSHNGYTVQSRYHYFAGSLARVRGPATLIDDFKANGYEVAYFSGQDESFGSAPYRVGFDRADVQYDARVDRGERYTLFTTPGSLAVPHTVLTRRIQEFLSNRTSSAPLFLYVNFHDTHFPYHHEALSPLVNEEAIARADIVPANTSHLLATYRNAAANVDAAVGRVLEMTGAALGVAPAVIVLADHGESLFDEGFLGHGYALNEAQTRIPIIVSGLPVALPEPFGQSDLRDTVWRALTDGDGRPRLDRQPGRLVFQYLGDLSRPRQIAHTSVADRVIYDFRSGRAQVGDSAWRSPEALAGGERERFLALVWHWERMRLAQAAGSRE